MTSSPWTERQTYPFAALVGQEQMKLSLLLNLVNPTIGGVLVRGQKGTAKSTAVRGLRELLPEIDVVAACTFNCHPAEPASCPDCRERASEETERNAVRRPPPLVDLPLGATEDMVLGSIDFEAAVHSGHARFLPGLLARAHRGLLYVDEVNLLDDHLVDSILDAAESGVNRVEREGVSVRHDSRFVLIGTMNPEEGELRPQLLDRFGLAVAVEAEPDPDQRVELLRRRERFDLDPLGLRRDYAKKTDELCDSVRAAQELLPSVVVPGRVRSFIAEICRGNHVAGHRADLAIERAAAAHGALEGRVEATPEDVLAVAPLALLHRMRNGTPDLPPPPPPPSEEPPDESERDEEDESEPREPPTDESEQEQPPEPPPRSDDSRTPSEGQPPQGEDGGDDDGQEGDVQEIGQPFPVRRMSAEKDRILRTGSGRRSRTRSATKQGRYVRSTPRRLRDDLALDATLRAAAPFQLARRQSRPSRLAVQIQSSDIREKIRERRVGNVILFVVDASGSMGAHRRMVETKAAIMSLLMDAYQKRDRVAMVVFRGREAELVLPPTSSVETAGRLLADLPVGGRTPLSAGLVCSADTIERIMRRDAAARPLVIVLTDGKANAALGTQPPHHEALAIAERMGGRFPQTRFIVIDTEAAGVVRLGLARKLSDMLGAHYFRPEELRAEELVRLAREG